MKRSAVVLKEIVSKLKLPEEFGTIVRTVGISSTKTLLDKDLRDLMRLWKNINKQGITKEAPSLLYKERNLAIRSIRDYLTPDITEILIDDQTVYNEIKEFVALIAPKQKKIVKLHKDPKPIFAKHQLETQIASIFESRVGLPSGGSIVINQTEALVAIDVNSGKATQKKSIEQTALLSNLEAAEEIARQLRLRDLGGLIVIDFIDMRESKHKNELERVVKSNLKIDKARTKTGRLSKFGLMEMSRQRIKPSIEFANFKPCRYCHGKGLTPSTEALSIGFLRELRMKTLKDNIATVNSRVPMEVADYLLNKKRSELLELESRRNLCIVITPDSKMVPGESSITCEEQ